MDKNWLYERIEFLETYLKENKNYPPAMKERDKNLIDALRKFSALPDKQQEKLEPILKRTFERYKKITRGRKIIDYYFKTQSFSLRTELK